MKDTRRGGGHAEIFLLHFLRVSSAPLRILRETKKKICCSQLFAKVWGEDNGVGVRSAVGMGSLPDNIPVEIEAMFELA